MKIALFLSFALAAICLTSCKKEEVFNTKTIENQSLEMKLSGMGQGNNAFEFSDPQFEALLLQHQIPSDKIVEVTMRLTNLRIVNSSTNNQLTFDDLKDVKFTVTEPGEPIKLGDVKLDAKSPMSTSENTNTVVTVAPAVIGRLKDVTKIKPGLQFLLLRDYPMSVSITATVSYDWKWPKV